MNPIGTPAFSLTADCIWNSFLSSRKRHLILTGGRKTGKSTLLNALFPALLPGITTCAEPKKSVCLMDNESRLTAQIGVFDSSLPGPENRMILCPEGFVSLGIPALQRCLRSSSEWVLLDEIGYLEAGCPEYLSVLHNLLDQKRVAAVLRRQPLPHLKEILRREDVFVVDLDAPFGDTGCVIMASGLGSRFGFNKLMANFHGVPLISRILSATDGLFSRRVVVTRHLDVADFCKNSGAEVVLHDLPHRSDTVRLGLEAVGEAERCMFCPGDQPLLRRETIAALALAGANGPDWIWRASHEDVPGSPALFPKWTFPQLLSLPEGKGGGYVIKKHPEQVRLLPVRDEYELMDADTQEDLHRLLMR